MKDSVPQVSDDEEGVRQTGDIVAHLNRVLAESLEDERERDDFQMSQRKYLVSFVVEDSADQTLRHLDVDLLKW